MVSFLEDSGIGKPRIFCIGDGACSIWYGNTALFACVSGIRYLWRPLAGVGFLGAAHEDEGHQNADGEHDAEKHRKRRVDLRRNLALVTRPLPQVFFRSDWEENLKISRVRILDISRTYVKQGFYATKNRSRVRNIWSF